MTHMEELAASLREGQVVYFGKSEQTDPFRHKRYSSICYGRSVILRGIVQSVKGLEFAALLDGNNGFERDGQTYVFNVGDLLADQTPKSQEVLGKWKEWDMSEHRKEK